MEGLQWRRNWAGMCAKFGDKVEVVRVIVQHNELTGMSGECLFACPNCGSVYLWCKLVACCGKCV